MPKIVRCMNMDYPPAARIKSNEMDFGNRKIPLFADNAQNVKKCLSNAGLKTINEIETESA